MCQMRLTSLGTLAVESELAKQLDFNEIIEPSQTKKRARLLSALPSLDNCMFMFMLFFYLLCT